MISAFPSVYFYQGLLRDGIDHKSRPSPKGFSWPNRSSPLAFVHVVGVEEGEENPNAEEQIGIFFVFVFVRKEVAPATNFTKHI